MPLRCFNPRPREGATSEKKNGWKKKPGFNPRPREGATIKELESALGLIVSIHAPVKGRLTLKVTGHKGTMFQSTPP